MGRWGNEAVGQCRNAPARCFSSFDSSLPHCLIAPLPHFMIIVSHLTKTYGAFKAVDDLSFEVGAGEIVGLIGPNGAGKTSTLRCVVGIQAPSAGTIVVD